MDIPLPLILDGATGTELQKRGLPQGACTEQWILEHPQVFLDLQKQYVAAGADVLLAPTFGANAGLLARFGLEGQVEDYNRRLLSLSRQAADGKALVAGDLSSTGRTMVPFGETTFEELVDLYAQQAGALEAAGVDLYCVETMTSMAEARAAVLAIRSLSEKPIFVTFYCDDQGRTPKNVDVLGALIVMQGMGVSAFGLNCTTEEDTGVQLARLAPYAAIPLIAKPAGGGGSAAQFAACAQGYACYGTRIFGGCCGSTPEDIAALRLAVDGLHLPPFAHAKWDPDVIFCATEKEARFITPDVDTGEIITCSPDLLEDILEAEDAPAGGLKIGIWSEDDLSIFAQHQYAIQDALCLSTDVPELLEAALRLYQGRAFWDGTEPLEDDFLAEMRQKYGLVLL